MYYGIDLDDSVWDIFTPALGYFNKKYGKGKTPITVPEVLRMFHNSGYRPSVGLFEDMYGLSHEDVNQIFIDSMPDISKGIRPFPLAINFLSSLKERNVPFVYITARNEILRSLTESELHRLGLPSADVYFTEDKVSVAKSLGVTSFIEDNVQNILNLREAGISCWMVDSAQNGVFNIPGVRRLFWNESLNDIRDSLSEAVAL